jgi:hypothetical protein
MYVCMLQHNCRRPGAILNKLGAHTTTYLHKYYISITYIYIYIIYIY